MILPILQMHEPESVSAGPPAEDWILWEVKGVSAMRNLIDELVGGMHRAGFPSKDVFSVRLATEEAVVNALKHGRKGQLSRSVQVGYQIAFDEVLVEVEDDGPGFDPSQVPDPLEGDNLERASGRGLFLMRGYTTWMSYNKRGNRVTFCRRRSSGTELGTTT